MSEIKRRPSDEESNGHVHKKRVLDSLSEDGPLTQEDVVYFQKEAIWRQMKQYKKQYQLIESQLRTYQEQAVQDAKKISYLIQWYKQAIANFDTSAAGVEPDENLLVKLDSIDDAELSQIRDSFISILTSVKGSSNESSSQIDGLNAQILKLTHQNKLSNNHQTLLSEQVESLKSQVLEMNKAIERANSKTIARIVGDVKKEEEVKQEATEGDDLVKKEEVVNNEEFEKLNIELAELKEVNANLTKQVNEEISLASNLKKELMNISLRLTNLKEEDLINSTHYQSIKNENESLSEEANVLRLKVKQYFTRITELENEKTQYKLKLTEELTKEKADLTKSLEKAEQDLARIRTNRDDLLSKNVVLKSDKSYKELIDELTSLVEIQKKRIDDLTKERQDLQAPSSSAEEQDKESLQKHNSMLVNELKDLETAFKEAHELALRKLSGAAESSSLINKLNVEKAKADQKYFSTMRVNDSLSQENKISKVTIAKQQELIASLKEMEKKFLSKIETMELKFKDLKFLENNISNENQQLKKKIIELSQKIESISKHNAKLVEISEKATSEKDSESNLRKQKENELIKLSSKLKSIETLNAKYKANLTGTLLQEDQEQINAFRAMVKCSVCSKNWKDTVIKNCGHVFCSDCAQERLAARLRRCPTCNKQFSSNDLLSIHL